MLKELFDKNNKIVINTDIDGFLSGMLLQTYYGCEVVGFSNSKETIWISPDVKSINDPIYIDLYVNDPNVVCIEQHIIAFDNAHNDKIKSLGTKFNPNLDRSRTFSNDYNLKYPFGTVHYLLSLMGREGVQVNLGNLLDMTIIGINEYKRYQMCPGHILLRADDALNTTLSRYRKNAYDWWQWLNPNNDILALNQIMDFIKLCYIEYSNEYRKYIGDFFIDLGCDGKDGAFDNIAYDNFTILPKVLNYTNIISNVMKLDLTLPKKYNVHKGVFVRTHCDMNSKMEILNLPNLYSYAFIYGPNKNSQNFSYTINLK